MIAFALSRLRLSPGLRPGTRASRPLALLRAFARDSRGAAALEVAVGAVLLLSVAAVSFDLYSRVEADTAAARLAVTMADYVSRDTVPDGNEMKALGEFLQKHQLDVPADVVFVVTAIHQPCNDPPQPDQPCDDPLPDTEVWWSDDAIRIGDPTVTDEIARHCARLVDTDQHGVTTVSLPSTFTMVANEVIVVAEVCAKLNLQGSLTGKFISAGDPYDIYRIHALPARDPDNPPKTAPAYAYTDGNGPVNTASLDIGHLDRTPPWMRGHLARMTPPLGARALRSHDGRGAPRRPADPSSAPPPAPADAPLPTPAPVTPRA